MKSLELCFVSSTILNVVFAQFDQFGGAQICPAFSCPKKDEVPVSKWPLKLSSTGCHSLSSGGMNMMQFNQPGKADEVITPCCDVYNACLQICGMSNVFCAKDAETCFDATCKAIKDKGDDEMHDQCTKDIVMKKIMVQFGSKGCANFEAGQKQNCQCVKEADVEAKRKKTLHGFYKKFNPDNTNKVDALMAKATDSKKFAGLLYKLVSKYPKAIMKMKDPQQKLMEEVMSGKFDTSKSEFAKSEEDSGVETESDERIEL